MNDNYMSYRQYCIMLLLLCIPFKIAMLPSYVAGVAQRDALYIIGILALVDVLVAYACYFVSDKGGLLNNMKSSTGTNKTISVVLIVFIAVISLIKLAIYLSEFMNFVSIGLFDELNWLYIALTLAPVLLYVASRRGFVIGRITEVAIILLLLTAGFSLIFNTIQFDAHSIRPIILQTATPKRALQFAWWTGDCLPLMMCGIKRSPSDASKHTIHAYTAAIFAVIMCYFVILVLTYGNALRLLTNTFAKIAIFNKVSDEIGAIEWPIIICWTVMSLIVLSVLTKTIFEPTFLSAKRKWLAYVIIYAVIIALTICLPKNLSLEKEVIIPSYIGWIGAITPITALVGVLCYRRNNEIVSK